MSRFSCFTLATAVLALSSTAAPAQLYPLTNGPRGAGPNVVDSAKGFDGINAVAPSREFLYHPERAGNAAAQLGVTAAPAGDLPARDAVPLRRHVRGRRRHPSRR